MQKYLIVGLGNIGEKYAETRHNIGFDVLEKMAEKAEQKFVNSNFGEIAQFKFKSRPVTLLKPNTYMNLSGKAVKFWLDKENIRLENLLIVTDDLNLDFGTIRMRGKGSDGGHNGLKNIQDVLQTTKYPKLRFGIGNKYEQGRQIDFVIGKWTQEERTQLPERISCMSEAAYSFIFNGLSNAMNQYNGK